MRLLNALLPSSLYDPASTLKVHYDLTASQLGSSPATARFQNAAFAQSAAFRQYWSSSSIVPKAAAAISQPVCSSVPAASSKQSFAAAPMICYSVKEGGEKPLLAETLKKAGKRALGGGIPGAAAMGIQVCSLMWMRTMVNWQYRNGGSLKTAFTTLYKEGGVRRFYRGVGPALIQGPLSRFGDTAANTGTLALLDSYDSTANLPVAAKTMCASTSSALFRIFLMPVDALKTTLQVEGANGVKVLRTKIGNSGITSLWHGSVGAMSANWVGHFPWFFTYNTLTEYWPQKEDDNLPQRLIRSACIGFASSFVSDTSSNSLRVLKTTKQTSSDGLSYPQIARNIIAKDGIVNGLLIRGLGTKIISNGLQGMMFTVLWRLGQDAYKKHYGSSD